ncbi:uncharacterized protein EDB91DRAFT_1126289 [Suillus paluster]|uniref:uncharacterized protein n=1 Tax=Suillus paluster TaxID=48578 RepID=UPI001B86380F|nr:uncharacterized protein EDB91DRAFT_1126289 [Suillus paluster]KAG1743217.1 hypothetical protein EDB91DRAFT_1126289 [Suillus paluster]
MDQNRPTDQFILMAAHAPSSVTLTTEYGRAHAADPHEEPFAEFPGPNAASQGFLNSGMGYFTSPQSLAYCDNHYLLNLMEQNYAHGSAHHAFLLPGKSTKELDGLSKTHSYYDSGVMRTSLQDEAALFVPYHRHQWRETYGTEATMNQAIRMCEGQRDTPDPNLLYSQMGRDELSVNISSSSTSHTGSQSSRSATHRLRYSGRAFRSKAVRQINHRIFPDGDRMKRQCVVEGKLCPPRTALDEVFVSDCDDERPRS